MRQISTAMERALLISLFLEACCGSGCGGRNGLGAFRARAGHRIDAEQAARIEQMSQQAQEAFDRGDQATGLGLLQRSVAANQASAEAHHRLARAYDEMGRFSEAEQEYRRSLEIDPDYIESLTNLGENQAAQGKPGEALKLLDNAIEMTPNSPQAHLERGKSLEKLGHVKDALAAYFRALESDPGLPEAQLRIAAIQLREGRNEQALARLNSAAEREPNNPRVFYERGLAYMQLHRPEQALADLNKAVKSPRFADQPEVLYHLALAQRANQRIDLARETNRRALGIAPNFLQARQLDDELRTRK